MIIPPVALSVTILLFLLFAEKSSKGRKTRAAYGGEDLLLAVPFGFPSGPSGECAVCGASAEAGVGRGGGGDGVDCATAGKEGWRQWRHRLSHIRTAAQKRSPAARIKRFAAYEFERNLIHTSLLKEEPLLIPPFSHLTAFEADR